MSTAFYKTSDPAVLATWAVYKAEAEKVEAAGTAFSEHFGGKLLTYSDVHGRRVAGLRFVPVKADPLWTKPEAQAHGRQRPRSSLKKATKEQRQALAELQADYDARFPKDSADLVPVLTAFGTDWGLIVLCGIGFFEHDGVIYVSTSAPLAPCMVEIVASEYSAAKAAYEKIKEAA